MVSFSQVTIIFVCKILHKSVVLLINLWLNFKNMRLSSILFRKFLSPSAKALVAIPPYIMEVITGMLLGDANLKKPSTTGQSALQVRQADQGFVKFLWDLFFPIGLVGAEPFTNSYYSKQTGKEHLVSGFTTFIFPLFAVLFFEWYAIINGCSIKHLPVNIADLLTPVALAFWIACDGTYHTRDGVVYISTENFTPLEVDQLRGILLEKHHINSTKIRHGKEHQFGGVAQLWQSPRCIKGFADI